jgi:hypothetical protein
MDLPVQLVFAEQNAALRAVEADTASPNSLLRRHEGQRSS